MDSTNSTDGQVLSGISYLGRYFLYTAIAGIFSLLFLFYFLKDTIVIWREKHFVKFLNYVKIQVNRLLHDRKVKFFKELKDSVPPGQSIRIVEIGSGAGANFKFYPKGTRVICVDPNKYFEKYLLEELGRCMNEVEMEEFRVGYAEDMSFLESGSVDAVVGTYVNCSIGDVGQALSEVRRILKPGGRYYFMEHVAEKDPHTSIALIQTICAPFWWAAFHCRLRSKAKTLIERAGFSRIEAEYYHANEWRDWPDDCWKMIAIWCMVPHYSGYAVK